MSSSNSLENDEAAYSKYKQLKMRCVLCIKNKIFKTKIMNALEIFFGNHIGMWMCCMCIHLFQHPKIRCINYNACSIFRQTFPLKIFLIQFCYLNFHSLNFSLHLFVGFGIFFVDVHCFKLLFKLSVRTLKGFAIRFQFS